MMSTSQRTLTLSPCMHAGPETHFAPVFRIGEYVPIPRFPRFGAIQANRVNPGLVNPDIRIPALHFGEQTLQVM